jgi:hypothetical protein
MASALLGGIGLKSLALIQPGLVTNAVSGVSSFNHTLYDSAVDDNGVVYVIQDNTASPGQNVWSVKGGVPTWIPITFSGKNGNTGPRSIAIDGAGVLYFTIGDYLNGLVTYDTVTGTAGSFSTASYPGCLSDNHGKLQYLDSVALDQWGNIFVHEDLCNQVYEIMPGGGATFTSTPGNQSVVGVDANDNLFLTGASAGIVDAVPGGTASTINDSVDSGYGEAIAIDAADTLYITRWPYPASAIPYGIGELAASDYEVTLARIDSGVYNSGESVGPLGLGLATDGTVYAGDYSYLDKIDRSQGAIYFGEVTFNTPSAPQVVGVYNGGNEDLTVDPVKLTQPAGWTDFSMAATTTSPCSLTGKTILAPGELCNVQVTLTTQHGGNLTGTVTFTSDGPLVQKVALSGYNYGPDFTALPSSLHFGIVAPNPSPIPSQTVTLTNNSLIYPASLDLTSLSGPSGFSVSTPVGATACSGWITMGGKCQIAIAYDPTTAMNSNGTLTFNQYISAGGGSYPFTIPVTAASVITPTTTTVISSLNPSVYGQSVTFTATVKPNTGSTPIPNGEKASFFNGTAKLGTGTLSSGKASFTTKALPTGTDSIAASYGGDTGFAGSTSTPISQGVDKASSTTTLKSSLNPSSYLQSVTFTATVSEQYGGTATGTVTFKDGSASLGSASLSGGKATLTTAVLAIGTDSITAVYGGDLNFNGSTSNAVSQKVGKAATTTVLASSVNPSGFGQSVKLTATVSGQYGGTPTGTVKFSNGSTSLGSATLSGGKASLTTTALPAGTDAITAVYGGDANYGGSTSAAIQQVVSKATTKTALTSSKNPSSLSQSVTFTATVTGQYGGTATGTVIFKDGTTALKTVSLSVGKAVLATTALAVGTHSITAVYGSDANFDGSSSTAVSQVVGKAATTTALTSSLNPSIAGQSVKLTAAVTGQYGGMATGTVKFSSGSTSLGSVSLSGGKAVLVTTALPVGTDSISAVYGGDVDFAGSKSNMVSQVVKAGATLITPTPGATLAGSSQTFTWTAPTGATNYALYLGSTAVGSSNLYTKYTTATTLTVNNLPVNGEKIYARLLTNFSGVWTHNDYTFTAK